MKNIFRSSMVMIVIILSAMPGICSATSTEDLKNGVVKIHCNASGETSIGTGVVVHVEQNTAYIVTALHVVEGDSHPQIAFYSEPNKFYSSRVIGLEGGDPKGMAALLVEGQLPTSIRPLTIDKTSNISGGETVTIIGFPGIVGSAWTITKGTISGRQGRDYTFSGIAEEGNSGGPLLFGDKLIGIITTYNDRAKFGYATPAEAVSFALNGWGVGFLTTNIFYDPRKRFGIDLPKGFFLKEPKKHDLVYEFSETGFPSIIIQFYPNQTKVTSLFSDGIDLAKSSISDDLKQVEIDKNLSVYNNPAILGIYTGIYRDEPKVALYGIVGAIAFPKSGLVYVSFLTQEAFQSWKDLMEKSFKSIRPLH